MILTRRTLLASAAAAAAMAGVPARAQARSIRHFWWGNPDRDRRTFEVIDLFKTANAGIDVQPETIGWGDYWTKMATQTAGGNMADVVQMSHIHISEYVGRGALRPLDEFVGNALQIGHYDAGANEVGTIDGKLYGLNIGSTSQSIPFNRRVFDEAGVEFDPMAWTTEEFAAVCARITEATGGKVVGSEDLSLYIENFEVWTRQNGGDLYSADGKLGMTEEDVRGYWEFWGALREAGHVEGKDDTVILDKGMADLGLVKGTSAMSFRYINQLGALQALVADPLGAAMVPQRPGLGFGHYVLPSMFLSLTRDAKDIEATIAYINTWVNNPDAIRILGLDRGIPPSESGRAELESVLNDIEKTVVGFYGGIQGKVGPVPNRAPKGSGEVRDAFMRIGTDVVLGAMPADEAAGLFMQEGADILDRAA